MLKVIFRILTVMAVILGIAGLALFYLVSSGTASPGPENVNIRTVLNNHLTDNPDDKLREEISLKRENLRNQLARLRNQERILNNKKAALNLIIEEELAEIREKYEEKIFNFKKNLEVSFENFREEKKQEYQEKILVKKESYKKRLDELIEGYKKQKMQELADYQQQLIDNYHKETLNYRLKLLTLDLSEEEEKVYKDKIAGLQRNQEAMVKTKEDKITENLQEEASRLRQEFDQEFLELQEKIEEEMKREINSELLSNEQVLENFIAEQEVLLNEEMAERRRELSERSKEEIVLLENLVREIRNDYLTLQSQIAKLEKEVIK